LSNVSIRPLWKYFGGKTPTTAIDNLDLEIEQGEFLVLPWSERLRQDDEPRYVAGLGERRGRLYLVRRRDRLRC
jgi:hypothetical protein